MATVTTTTTTTSGPSLGISIDRGYVNTLFGRFNILTLAINALCFICVAAQPWAAYIPPQGWFYFVCVTGFWSALLELFLGLCRIQERMVRIVPWKLGLLIFYGLWSFFYLTAASAVTHYAANYEKRDGWYAGTVFGFIATIIYGIAAYYRLLDWKGASPVSVSQPA
ncbi:uncharacterized protein LOC130686142 isoform X2 [Daphnia carinata]|nr:uncharacterized protein LOC130686142 isoform X2 [Daphnia carinata]XP_057365433.1 uncharacterized protein LOC130686142 isoform X2 [Daphnia carinata]XP_059352145.1 uncharacterized protein LOC130686142 isoform X2 [Daphnia carinata]